MKKKIPGLLLAFTIGLLSFFAGRLVLTPLFDSLLCAMVVGIILGSFLRQKSRFHEGLVCAPGIFIPIGAVFYGAVNLNFVHFLAVDVNTILLLIMVFIIYVVSALILAAAFRLREKTGYLIATGSAVCGASAITITSEAIEAEPDDVSVSLIAVFFAAVLGLFVVIPTAVKLFNMTDLEYGIFSGSVLQFTGFVKASVSESPENIAKVAMAVKAVRYMALLFVIPLFASLSQGKFRVPWFLFGFLVAGLLFSFVPGLSQSLRPLFKIILSIFWATAMSAIGLNANLKKIFTKNGLKAFCVSFFAFMIASAVFVMGIYL